MRPYLCWIHGRDPVVGPIATARSRVHVENWVTGSQTSASAIWSKLVDRAGLPTSRIVARLRSFSRGDRSTHCDSAR